MIVKQALTNIAFACIGNCAQCWPLLEDSTGMKLSAELSKGNYGGLWSGGVRGNQGMAGNRKALQDKLQCQLWSTTLLTALGTSEPLLADTGEVAELQSVLEALLDPT